MISKLVLAGEPGITAAGANTGAVPSILAKLTVPPVPLPPLEVDAESPPRELELALPPVAFESPPVADELEFDVVSPTVAFEFEFEVDFSFASSCDFEDELEFAVESALL